MIDFFPKSRHIAVAGSIIGSILGVCAVWILYDGQLSTKLVIMLLAVVIIVNSFIYIAQIAALRNYQELLLELYEKMEIKSFLEKAVPLLEKRASVKDSVTHAVHVANAYLAEGDAQAAVDLLEAQRVPERALELRGTVYSNLGSAYLQLGDTERAEHTLKQLLQIVRNPKCKKEFRQKAERIIAYQQVCLDSLRGKKEKIEMIEKDYENTSQSLHKLNAGIFLMKLYQQTGEIKKLEEITKYIDSIWRQQMVKF